MKTTYSTYESTRKEYSQTERIATENQYSTPPPPDYRTSTAHLAKNHVDQAAYIRNQLDAIRDFEKADKLNEAMANLHGMMCEGSFTLWNQFFDELLDSIYQVIVTVIRDLP